MVSDHWKALISPKVGVIRNVAPQLRGSEEPTPPYLYTATLSNFDFHNVDKTERMGAGKGVTEKDAMASAIGEAIERYCAFQWDPYRTFLAKWNALSPAASISPAELVLYSDDQYSAGKLPYIRWKEDADVTWIHGVEMPSGRPVALPASLVYLVHPVPRHEDFFAPASSNGLAAGPTLQGAILAGICELMERDALLVAWMNRLPAIELDLSTAGSLVTGIQKHYKHFFVDVRGELDEAEAQIEFPRGASQVIGIDQNAMAADSRRRVVRQKSEGLGLGGLGDLPSIKAHSLT